MTQDPYRPGADDGGMELTDRWNYLVPNSGDPQKVIWIEVSTSQRRKPLSDGGGWEATDTFKARHRARVQAALQKYDCT